MLFSDFILLQKVRTKFILSIHSCAPDRHSLLSILLNLYVRSNRIEKITINYFTKYTLEYNEFFISFFKSYSHYRPH